MAHIGPARRHQILILMAELKNVGPRHGAAGGVGGRVRRGRYPVLYCGVGKVNAAIALTRELRRYARRRGRCRWF